MANRLVHGAGTLLEGFESIGDWSVTGTGASGANDSTYFKTGTQGIRLTSVNAVSCYAAKVVNIDMSAAVNVKVSVYINDWPKVNNVAIYLSNNSGNTADSMLYSWANSKLTYGWNDLCIATSAFTPVGTGTFASPILRISIRVGAQSGQDCWATWDDLRMDYEAKPVVIITFDDAYGNQLTNAYPILNGNGQRAVVFPYYNAIGTGAYMTEANLATLYAAMWDVGSHTVTHADLTGLTAAQVQSEIETMRDYLIGLGFTRSAAYLAYPYGYTNWAVYDVARVKTRLARITSTNVTGTQAHHDGTDTRAWFIKAFSVANTHSVANLTALIDAAIADSEVLCFVFHSIVDADADTSVKWLTANFSDFSDYIKTKTDAGLLKCMTFYEYESAYSSRYKRVAVT